MGLFASLVAFASWNSAVPQAGSNRAMLFLHLHPDFTTVFAVILLGEFLRRHPAAGIVLIVPGLYVTTVALENFTEFGSSSVLTQ